MGDHVVLTLTKGGVRLTMLSSSLFVALRMVVSSSNAKSRTSRAVLTFFPTLAPSETPKQTLQALVVWKDVTDYPDALCSPPLWELVPAMKTCASNAALALLREVFMAVVGHIVAQRDAVNGSILMSSPRSPLISSEQRTLQVPRIVVTPPDDDSSASVNAVPTPQNAAFGNQLIIPDLEFKVINRRIPENPFSDDVRAEDYRTESPARLDDERDSDDSEHSYGVHGGAILMQGDEEDEDEDAAALGLGPTWSG